MLLKNLHHPVDHCRFCRVLVQHDLALESSIATTMDNVIEKVRDIPSSSRTVVSVEKFAAGTGGRTPVTFFVVVFFVVMLTMTVFIRSVASLENCWNHCSQNGRRGARCALGGLGLSVHRGGCGGARKRVEEDGVR
jgi:hypothetical protein